MTRRARVIIKVLVYRGISKSTNSTQLIRFCFGTKSHLAGSRLLGSGEHEVENGRGSGRAGDTFCPARGPSLKKGILPFWFEVSPFFCIFPRSQCRAQLQRGARPHPSLEASGYMRKAQSSVRKGLLNTCPTHRARCPSLSLSQRESGLLRPLCPRE